jgi:hypothetical protein
LGKRKKTSLKLGTVLFSFLFLLTSSSIQANEGRGTPAAHLLSGESASEHWELTARFDSGHLLFAEFLITNIGLGDRNAAASGHLVAPDGQIHQFNNGRREGHWTLSPDRLRFEIGPSRLDLHAPDYRLVVQKKNLRLDLHFQPDGPAIWSEALSSSGYALDLLAAAVPVAGTLWVTGMAEPLTVHGTLAATHSWMNEAGPTLVLRRLQFFTLQEDFPLYGIDLTSPKGIRTRWIVVKRQERKTYETQRFALSLTNERKRDQEKGYEVPNMMHFKNAELDGQVQLEQLMVQNDPLAALPRPFRLLVSLALNLRPRQMWVLSPFEITLQPDRSVQLGSPAVAKIQHEEKGTGITAITFLNPMAASKHE